MVAMNEPGGRGEQRERGDRRPSASGGVQPDGGWVDRLKGNTSEAVRQVASQVRTTARDLGQAAGEMTHSAADALRQRARDGYEQQKKQAVARAARAGEVAAHAANALRAVKADNVAGYLDGASRQMGQATDYLEEHTLTQMIQDANRIARRNRAVAAGGMLLAGFALTRFLKASASRAAVAPADSTAEAEDASEADVAATHVATKKGRARPSNGAGRPRLADASTAL